MRKEALNLSGVQIDADRAGRARFGDQVGDQTGGDGFARLDLFVLPRIAVVGQHDRDALRRRPPKRIDHDQQFHQVIVDGTAGRLDDENVRAARRFLDLDANLAVVEVRHLHLADRHVQMVRDTRREAGVGVAGKQA